MRVKQSSEHPAVLKALTREVERSRREYSELACVVVRISFTQVSPELQAEALREAVEWSEESLRPYDLVEVYEDGLLVIMPGLARLADTRIAGYAEMLQRVLNHHFPTAGPQVHAGASWMEPLVEHTTLLVRAAKEAAAVAQCTGVRFQPAPEYSVEGFLADTL